MSLVIINLTVALTDSYDITKIDTSYVCFSEPLDWTKFIWNSEFFDSFKFFNRHLLKFCDIWTALVSLFRWFRY